MRHLLTLCLVLTGLIHLLPVPGVMGADALKSLYGVDLGSADLMLLMRHRAVLFGLLGSFLLFAAWRRAWIPVALVAGWISVVSFLVLEAMGGPHGAAIQRVVMADWVALAALCVATVIRWRLGNPDP
ncbi:MAG: phosphopantetheine adenylyltransferase [Betaproteobacteria bacterium]|nr:phosphopantetheine adenylyltransferase [Betaproteobacteria bacterium]